MGENRSPEVSLTPSQALNANARSFKPNGGDYVPNSTGNDNNAGNKPKRRNNRQRRKENKAKSKDNQEEDSGTNSNAPSRQGQGRRRQLRKQGGASAGESANAGDKAGNQQNNQGKKGKGRINNRRNTNGNNRKGRKRYPWRRFIPNGTMDPITLENLISLEYPPFALVADAPYTAVPIWPLPQKSSETTGPEKSDSAEEANRKRLQEQWGSSVIASEARKQEEQEEEPLDKRHMHLYDGRALAYYLVSQLQFIDPLNRRDLTRPELLNLDDYLKRHGFNDIRVTEAYDAKGVTLSSAGAAAGTSEGQAEILQQIATNLLNSLFGGQSARSPAPASPPAASAPPSSLQEQYAALRRQEEEVRSRRQQAHLAPFASDNPFGDSGFYNFEDGGVMVVDDDENPGLRGDVDPAIMMRATPQAIQQSNFGQAQGQAHPFYSARHIADRYGHGRSMNSTDAFPALPSAPAPTQTSNATGVARSRTGIINARKPAPVSKTLSRITGAVKKSDPDEMQRQWEAREEARRRAILSNLSFGATATNTAAPMQDLPQPPSTIGSVPFTATEGQISRNKALSEILGVKPATVRNQFNSGWARPTVSKLSTDEFGNELNAALYPQSLVVEARECIQLVLKIEKKWKAFLANDSAASLPLNAMDRPARKFVHHYSDFWKLRTESFDPEPKRYIHCVKMADTVMPHPLLSDAARNWRGASIQATNVESDHTVQQTAGQTSSEHLILSKVKSLEAEGAATLDAPQNSRFDALSSGPKERPKLELAKRTVPLELPPFEPQKDSYNLADDMKKTEERQKKKKEKEVKAAQRQQKALEAAFASDSEDEVHNSDGEWQEESPEFNGEDDE